MLFKKYKQEYREHESIKHYLKRGGQIIKLQAKLISDHIEYTKPKGATVKKGILYNPIVGFFGA